MNVSRSHFSLSRGLLISVIVHGLPFIFVIVLTSFKFAVPERQTNALQVELFGMVTGQQVAGHKAVAAVEEHAAVAGQAVALPQQQESVSPPEPPSHAEQKSVAKPVPVRAQKGSAPVPHRQFVPASPGQQARGGQVQQTISKRDVEASLTRQYLAELTRIVRNRLVYPVKAKAKGWTGVTLVAFTVSEGGSVVPGSESVRKTSGFDELDKAALNVVRSSGHLPNPPHQMEVVVAIEFTKSDS